MKKKKKKDSNICNILDDSKKSKIRERLDLISELIPYIQLRSRLVR